MICKGHLIHYNCVHMHVCMHTHINIWMHAPTCMMHINLKTYSKIHMCVSFQLYTCIYKSCPHAQMRNNLFLFLIISSVHVCICGGMHTYVQVLVVTRRAYQIPWSWRSSCVSAGGWPLMVWKSNSCSQCLSHVSNPKRPFLWIAPLRPTEQEACKRWCLVLRASLSKAD